MTANTAPRYPPPPCSVCGSDGTRYAAVVHGGKTYCIECGIKERDALTSCRECAQHLRVMHSPSGYYLGTEHDGMPICRATKYYEDAEDAGYWLDRITEDPGCITSQSRDCAENAACPGYAAITGGDNGTD